MTFTHALSTNNYGPAKFIVSANAYEGTHTTIAAALTSASSGDTIFIRPGTYTENLTLKAGVNICAYGPTAGFNTGATGAGQVIIIGKLTFTAAGTVGLYGIVLQTNSDFALAVTGTLASIVVLQDCFLSCTNNTGVSFTSSSASSRIQFEYCEGDLTTTGIAIFAHSGAGNMRFVHSFFANTGASLTANTISGTGNMFPNFTAFGNGLSFSSSSTSVGDFIDLTMQGNQTAITTANTSSVNYQHAVIATGTSTAINVGSGTTVSLENSMISSSNGTTVTGSGTFTTAEVTYNSVMSIASTVLVNPRPTTSGWHFIQSLSASNSASLEFKTGFNSVFASYAVMFHSIIPVTDGAILEMLVSTNGGSTYVNSGYQTGINVAPYNSTTLTNTNSTTYAVIAGASSNSAGPFINGQVIVSQDGYVGTVSYALITTGTTVIGTCGGNLSTSGINALKFLFSTGNISSGSISLYGIP